MPNFVSSEPAGRPSNRDGFCEVLCKSVTILHDLPTMIGFQVLSLAKIRLLNFYYGFLRKFIPKDSIELILGEVFIVLYQVLDHL